MKKRLNIYLKDEEYDLIKYYSEKWGLSMSQLISLTINRTLSDLIPSEDYPISFLFGSSLDTNRNNSTNENE